LPLLKGAEDMPVLESKKVEKDSLVPGQPAHETNTSEIENALNFLDSEEYQEVRQPIPRIIPESKKQTAGKTQHHDASKPLATEPESVISSRQEDSTIQKARLGKVPPRTEKKPIKNSSESQNRPEGKKSGKFWFFCLGTAVLILFIILILYAMGYLFTGPSTL